VCRCCAAETNTAPLRRATITNAYCQDNEISWLEWDRSDEAQRLTEFTARLVHFRHAHPIFHQPRFFQGRDIRGQGVKDITWFDGEGAEMTDEAWQSAFARTFGVMLAGDSLAVKDYFGNPIRDETFLLYFNAHHEDVEVRVPGEANVQWQLILNSADENGFVQERAIKVKGGGSFALPYRSVLLLQQMEGSDDQARHWYQRRR
jgi:isoamylase